MIRSAVDAELFTELGIICVHAHIYTDRVADSEALQTKVEEIFKRVREELRTAGLLELKADGTPRRDTVSKDWRGTTTHGKGKRR